MAIVNYVAHIAKEHTKEMESRYHTEIQNSIRYTKEYKDGCVNSTASSNIQSPFSGGKTKIRIIDADSVTALFNSDYDDNIAMLNFASYKNPGGRFIDGSRAQEEAICHESTLYNILKEWEDKFYEPNRTRLNNALYHSNLLYVPDVVFERNDVIRRCDVITCAAPNRGVALRYKRVSDEEYLAELSNRIDAVLYSAYDNGVRCLILGAFGCGVFKNNPEDVAKTFKHFINGKYNDVFKEIIFPIPRDSRNGNLDTFRNVFDK